MLDKDTLTRIRVTRHAVDTVGRSGAGNLIEVSAPSIRRRR